MEKVRLLVFVPKCPISTYICKPMPIDKIDRLWKLFLCINKFHYSLLLTTAPHFIFKNTIFGTDSCEWYLGFGQGEYSNAITC